MFVVTTSACQKKRTILQKMLNQICFIFAVLLHKDLLGPNVPVMELDLKAK